MQTDLTIAGGLLRRALQDDPALGEAHIRLAHVLGADGSHEDALAELDRARALPLPPLLRFDAWLLTAREDLALGRDEDGRKAAGSALALYPDARSARILMSALLRAAGNRAAALTALVPLGRPVGADSSTTDPWQSYDRQHAPGAAQLLEQLYSSVP